MSTLSMPGMPPAAEHPLFLRLMESGTCPAVTVAEFENFAGLAGDTLVFFSEEPGKYREVLDLAVILPELVKAFAGRFRSCLLLPDDARALQPRFGFNKWPALVMLRNGEYVGAIAGLRDWNTYVTEVRSLLESGVSRPPAIGIAVHPASGQSHCH